MDGNENYIYGAHGVDYIKSCRAFLRVELLRCPDALGVRIAPLTVDPFDLCLSKASSPLGFLASC